MISSEGGGGGASAGPGAAFAVGALLGTYGGLASGGGSGKKAARGYAQSAAFNAAVQARFAAIDRLFARASEERLTRFAPGERTVLDIAPAVTDETRRLAARINQLQAASRPNTREILHVQNELAKAQLRAAPQATVRYVAQYGVNSGPPIAGSADDPRGGIRPPTHLSLIGGR